MRTILLLLNFTVSCAQLTQAQTHKVTLTPIADTYLDEQNPTSNVGGHRSLFVGPQGRVGVDKDLVALVKFNLAPGTIPGVPHGSTITGALLNLYLITEGASAPFASGLTSSDFTSETEKSITWNSVRIGAQGVRGMRFDGTPNGYRFDVSLIINSCYKRSEPCANGFLIAAAQNRGTENTYNTFYGRQSSHPPELVVLYDPPPPVWEPFDSRTMAVQSAVGLGDAALGLLMFYAGQNSPSIGASFWGAIGAAGAAIALPCAIYYYGEVLGGDGSLFWSVVGCAVAGGGMAALSASLSPDNGKLIAALTVVFAIGGSVLGYHYFASPVYEDPGTSVSINQAGNLQMPHAQSVRATLISIDF